MTEQALVSNFRAVTGAGEGLLALAKALPRAMWNGAGAAGCHVPACLPACLPVYLPECPTLCLLA